MDFLPCNFRSILPNCDSKRQPNIYRSNTLDDGTTKSCVWLTETIRIKSYVDLREEREFHEDSKMNLYFVSQHDRKNKDDLLDKTISERCRLHVPFLTFLFFLKLIIFKLSWYQLYNILIIFIKNTINFDQKDNVNCFSYFLNTIGLANFYCILLKLCRNSFKTIFLYMTKKENFPMLISCSLGKDRTGIVSAIVMQLAGCTEKEIIEEYSASEKYLLPMQSHVHKIYKQNHLNEEFEKSHPKEMEQMLYYLRESYGGAEEYLLYCGLSRKDIDKVKENIQHRRIKHK